jgi:hypothetical protein
MKLGRIILKEIGHRKLNFGLGIAAVLIAVAVLVGQLTLLHAHDVRTREILDAKVAETEKQMAKNEDEYRKIMKELGYNLLLLPEGQRLDDFFSEGYAAKNMPEENVTRLSEARIMTIQHLLPLLEQKIRWPEQGQRTVILVGIRGEVPYSHRDPREPMMVPVPKGSAVLGHEIWESLDLEKGDTITLLGREFTVADCNPERGTKDDITVWIDLAEAQEMLDRKGTISGILALKCHCQGNSIGEVRQSVARILPGVQVIELANMVTVRAKARDQARETALAAIAAEKANRENLRRRRESLTAWLVPLVTVACAAWIGILAFLNVRERRPEIGILRALGFRSGQVMTVFLTRALIVGCAGAVAGYVAGMLLALGSSEASLGAGVFGTLLDPVLLAAVMVGAPLLAVLASYPPALIAAREDPAVILNDG